MNDGMMMTHPSGHEANRPRNKTFLDLNSLLKLNFLFIFFFVVFVMVLKLLFFNFLFLYHTKEVMEKKPLLKT